MEDFRNKQEERIVLNGVERLNIELESRILAKKENALNQKFTQLFAQMKRAEQLAPALK